LRQRLDGFAVEEIACNGFDAVPLKLATYGRVREAGDPDDATLRGRALCHTRERGPIFLATPRMRISPGARTRSSTSAGLGSVNGYEFLKKHCNH